MFVCESVGNYVIEGINAEIDRSCDSDPLDLLCNFAVEDDTIIKEWRQWTYRSIVLFDATKKICCVTEQIITRY